MAKTLEDNLVNLFSSNRLSFYKYDSKDTDSMALERYLYNIEVLKSLYPLLSILEISLRNRINQAIETVVKSNWLLNELNNQNILLPNEYKKLLDAKQKLLNKGHKNICTDDLIAELSLGFWIHLCTKRYKTVLWHRQGFFRTVFADYPNFSEFDKLSKVFPILQLMLKLRNRVFHHEIIINHSYGINNCYKDLRRLLGYISKDSIVYLDKICDFNNIITKQKPQ
ncbi:hypothetical protein J6P92_03615 [bacterium]|nr:hypothetical protein [bacterium]